MAHVIANTDLYPKEGVFSSIVANIATMIREIAEANPRLRRVRALQALSDDQLAALGIARAEIVHVVFRDTYYR